MKNKIIILILLLSTFFFYPSVKAEGMVAKVNDNEYPTLTEAIANAEENIIYLLNDIQTDSITIDNDKNITIDLNGHTINAIKNTFIIQKGKLKLTGIGTVSSDHSTSINVTIRVVGSDQPEDNDKDVSVLTIDKDVTLKGDAALLLAKGDYYGRKIDIYGKIIGQYYGINVNGSIKTIENAPKINLYSGSSILGVGDDLYEGIPLYLAGYSFTTIDSATIKGSGVGIGIKAGKINIKNTNIECTGEYNEPQSDANGINPTGAAIYMESNSSYAKGIELTIDGGTYKSQNGNALLEHTEENTTNIKQLSIKGGSFISPTDKKSIEVTSLLTESIGKFISGGEFSDDVSSLMIDGYTLTKNENGNYSVDVKAEPKPEEEKKEPPTPLKNPNTNDTNIIVIATLVVASFIGIRYILKKIQVSNII